MIDLAQEFPLESDLLYLNHAAVAPWPSRTADAVSAFARENVQQGARHYPRWLGREQRLREQLAALIGAADPLDVGLLKNTSEGLSFIAAGLPWEAGDEIVISNQEFPSNRIPWEALAGRGVKVVAVDLDGEDPEGALIDALGERTRLLAISAVQYGTGLRLDLARLGAACHARDILFCIDAIQWLGALPFDVGACHADFVVADGHKWMLGPEGLALFWVRPALRDGLAVQEYGWHMVADAGNYDRHDWTLAPDIRRFECGSPNMLCTHALSASLSLLLEVGMDTVGEAVLERSDYLIDKLAPRDDIELVTPAARHRRAGIVTFRHRRIASADLYQQLRTAGVVCAPRGGGVRLSPHFYTPYSVMDRALAAL